jgi:hypothetical protein
MDDELKQRLIKYLDKMEEAVDGGSDFILDQAPLVVQEYLLWQWWLHLLAMALSILVIVPCVLLGVRLIRESYETDNEQTFGWGMLVIAISGCLLVPAIGEAFTFLKVAIAPRIVVMEYLAELVN